MRSGCSGAKPITRTGFDITFNGKMYHQIGRVSCFVLFFWAVFSVLLGGSCLRQPYHNPADPFASTPVAPPDNQVANLPHQHIYPNQHQTTSIQQAGYSSLPPAGNFPNSANTGTPTALPNNYRNTNLPQNRQNQFAHNEFNLPTTLPATPKYEIQQLTSVSGAVQNNYRYNNSLNNRQNNFPANSANPTSTPPNYSPSNLPNNPWGNSPNYLLNNSSGDVSINRHSAARRNSNQEVLQVSLQSPQPSDVSDNSSSIMVDPSLKELGANVIAEANEGKEIFNGGLRPDGSFGFWRQEEYLADGGDGNGTYGNAKVAVDSDWTVRNLDTGDTVAHYDTVDGRTVVEASNQVHIYAPRFGAVRKIEGVINTDHLTSLSAINQQERTNTNKSAENTKRTEQGLIAGYTRSRADLEGVRSRVVGAGVGASQNVGGYSNFEGVMSYSDVLRSRKFGSAEIIHLAEACQNAREWQGTEGVKINASYRTPMSVSVEEGVGQLFKIDDSGVASRSKLRLIKVASKKSAKSGDIIEFTLRFDNLGTEPLGNITVIDNLTTRLQFLPDSAKSSVPSGFLVESNGALSFTLRFEVTDPLEAGQFGVIQFSCRVL
ncbi:MAG: hypothetical protein LBJ00_18750 [Planctomycetaceae bacterium]|jgi:uncharacterized repeat protein (TIGR01451 family)|nr:hypothetical protein [Planctomycetaceae bacterium]